VYVYIPLVLQNAMKKWPEYFKEPSVKHLTERLLEVCWRLNLQYPSVYMDTSTKNGHKFDTEKYRKHKHSGDKVDYVLFPAVLECRGGELLVSGVAEGITN